MSSKSAIRARDWALPFRSWRDSLVRWIFGDGLGVVIFLGGLLYFALYWRIGIFITDNWTIANTFFAISDGHLYVDRTLYGPTQARTPGYHIVDGRFYGRNYGQLFLSLPALYSLKAISALADLRIAIAGFWSILLVEFSRKVGAEFEERTTLVIVGSIGALVVFAINTAVARPLEPQLIYLLALQFSTIITASWLGVIIYRLLSAIHDHRTGLFVAVSTILATPVAFWAPIPKRHILVSFLALVTLYAFYVSRASNSQATALRSRCLAYASVGVWAWVHAPEALLMFVVLLPFDLATARSNDWRRIGSIAATFIGSLIPFFATNYLISGNPVKPPRFLSRTTGDGGIVSPGNVGTGGLLAELLNQFSPILRPFTALIDLILSGLTVFATEPHRVLATFIRSAPALTRATATDLTILETTPIFGVFVIVPVSLYLRWRSTEPLSISLSSPVRQTDAFAVTFVVAFTLLYMSRLPLHAMWTVRYLLPIVPFGMYFVGRLGPVRRIITNQGRLLAYSYASLVLIGGQLLVVYLVTISPSLNEAMQFHAMLGLAAASVAGLWALATIFDRAVDDRIGAVALSMPLAAGTLFVLLTGIEYYVVGHFALGMSELLSEAIPLF